ncbi:MAG: nickel pincer cofactor biosynthesis protein LarC [Phycisphaerales bacterium]|nr:nickel pincer cofactor biosynthesis protein LarC [Phycisphaerales bacterium]
MMRIGYFDCFSGAAGDMILAALIDAGCDPEALRDVVRRLALPEVTIDAERVKRHGIAATYVRVNVGPAAQKKHRHLHHIVQIIDAAGLSAAVADRAKRIFLRLAEAEAHVHNTTIEKVHFHEVGAADAIVDIVCVSAAVELLGLDRIECSPIPTGSGTVRCEHGVMPVPAPATARLLIDAPIAACDETGELTTPTGAAVLTTLAKRFGGPPNMTVRAIGCGAGTRDGVTRPNIMRLLIGEQASDAATTDTVIVLEAQIDDANGQVLAYACEQLLRAGALDAYITPIMMKKGRPAHLLTVLGTPGDYDRLEAVIFRETPTLGVRRTEAQRTKLARHIDTVQTSAGSIRVKVANRDGRSQAWPEYDDCAAAAASSNRPLREIQDEALRIWHSHHFG